MNFHSIEDIKRGGTAIIMILAGTLSILFSFVMLREDFLSSYYGWSQVNEMYGIRTASSTFNLAVLSGAPQVVAIVFAALWKVHEGWSRIGAGLISASSEGVDVWFDLWYRSGTTGLMEKLWNGEVIENSYAFYWMIATTSFYTVVAGIMFSGGALLIVVSYPDAKEFINTVWPPEPVGEPVRLGMDQSRLTRMNVRRRED